MNAFLSVIYIVLYLISKYNPVATIEQCPNAKFPVNLYDVCLGCIHSGIDYCILDVKRMEFSRSMEIDPMYVSWTFITPQEQNIHHMYYNITILTNEVNTTAENQITEFRDMNGNIIEGQLPKNKEIQAIFEHQFPVLPESKGILQVEMKFDDPSIDQQYCILTDVEIQYIETKN